MRPVGSKYLLEEPLGRGATGTVWRARQRETAGAEAAVAGQPGETVAIKVLKEELANDADVVMRFLRERSVLLRLQHHNIVRTRDLVVEGDMLALVMDLVDGPDLHHYLRDNGPFTAVAASLVTAQVADALAVSHADGVVHRDLKPANVLLSQDAEGAMRPMLTDFGIARLADSPGLTRTQEFVGTPSYVAPESAEGRPQTSAVDVYGAGVLLYELVTGHPPFSGGSTLEVLQRHLSEQPQRPQGIPEPLWTVLERCLRKNPDERPSAVNLARALRTVANGIGANATAEQAGAAMGVAALLAPDPAPAQVPDSGAGDGSSASGGAGGAGAGGVAGAAAAGALGGAAAGAAAGYAAGQAQDADATEMLPRAAAHGQEGFGQGGQGQGGQGQDPNADPTQVMPPVPGAPPQPQQAPQAQQPEGPPPWGDQLQQARDRNEQTQVQPLDPNIDDPLRRRPSRHAGPPPGGQPYGQQYAQPYGQGPGGQQYGGPQQQRPPQRPPQHPPQRREPPREPEREPRQRREPRRRANPMHIPGLGCLKGCLFLILILVVICVLVWNFTPLPDWVAQGKSFWETVTDWFGQVQDLVNSGKSATGG